MLPIRGEFCQIIGHLFSRWSDPIGGPDDMQYQERSCIRCNVMERRLVEFSYE